jgi:hypothetical protein
MTGNELREKLIASHVGSYDLTPRFTVGNTTYDVYAHFSATSVGYVLVRAAELYQAHSFEHTFINVFGQLRAQDLFLFRSQIAETIEPELVRAGNAYPAKDHMCSFVTGLFVSEKPAGEAARQAAENFRYGKSYLLSWRGYCLARIVVFDLAAGEIFGSPYAREVVKGYKKARYI